MKAELREMLGKAAYEAVPGETLEWDQLFEESREMYRIEAEAAITKLAEILVAPISSVLFSEEDLKRMLEQLVQEKILTITPE